MRERARATSTLWIAALCVLALFACSRLPEERGIDRRANVKLPVDGHCYLTAFEPARFPWKDTECLNYEEVFKNHTYYEARSNAGAQTITVTVAKFVRGEKVEESSFIAVRDRDTWTLRPDSSHRRPP